MLHLFAVISPAHHLAINFIMESVLLGCSGRVKPVDVTVLGDVAVLSECIHHPPDAVFWLPRVDGCETGGLAILPPLATDQPRKGSCPVHGEHAEAVLVQP